MVSQYYLGAKRILSSGSENAMLAKEQAGGGGPRHDPGDNGSLTSGEPETEPSYSRAAVNRAAIDRSDSGGTKEQWR